MDKGVIVAIIAIAAIIILNNNRSCDTRDYSAREMSFEEMRRAQGQELWRAGIRSVSAQRLSDDQYSPAAPAPSYVRRGTPSHPELNETWERMYGGMTPTERPTPQPNLPRAISPYTINREGRISPYERENMPRPVQLLRMYGDGAPDGTAQPRNLPRQIQPWER